MTLLCNSHIKVSLGFLFHQVYSLSVSSSSTPEVFFSAVFMCGTDFSEVAASEFSQRGLALVYDFMYDFHGLMGLSSKRLCVCSTFEAFVCISCWATMFSNVATGEQS